MSTRFFLMLTGGVAGGQHTAFAPPQLIIAGNEIHISIALVNAYPPELRQLAQTATPVPLYVFAQVRESGRRRPVAEISAENLLSYDLIGKRFRISRSMHGDTLYFSNLDSAINTAAAFSNLTLCRLDSIKDGRDYSISAYAVLGKANVEALDGRAIDLMYYWNYRRPSIKTESIAGEQLLKAKR